MQWYETDRGSERLDLEAELLAIDWPQMNISRGNDGMIRVYGPLGPGDLVSRSYEVVVELPADYPHSPPRVWCPEENFPSDTPHLYPMSDQRLCIEHGDYSPTDTVATVLAWSLQWLALFEEFQRTGTRW